MQNSDSVVCDDNEPLQFHIARDYEHLYILCYERYRMILPLKLYLKRNEMAYTGLGLTKSTSYKTEGATYSKQLLEETGCTIGQIVAGEA